MAKPTIQETLALAVQHHQAGRLGQAEQLYRQILDRHPQNANALHMLGVMAFQQGRLDDAVELIRQSIAFKPDYPEAYSNLGMVLSAKGRGDEAADAFRQAIALKPNYAEAHHNLGTVLSQQGQVDEAIAAYRQAIAIKPSYPEAHSNLGNALSEQGRLDEALAAYRQAIALRPGFAEVYGNLGIILSQQGRLDEAIAAHRQAIALKPNYAHGYNNLGVALSRKGRQEDAIAAFREAIVRKPNYPEPYGNLGNALRENGQLDEAIAAYRQAIALKPNWAEAESNLGLALRDVGQMEEAIAASRRAIALKPDYAEGHSNLVLALHYPPGIDGAAIAEEHRRWNQLHAEPLREFIQPHANDRNPERRLRIGYVSPDFRQHPVGRFLLPLLANHGRKSLEVFAYAQVFVADAMSERLRSHTDAWRSLVGLSDAQAADLIRQDRIDILVDLAGHTASNRLLVFARKPAPVQVTYLGYPDTTGLSTMDYRLTDAFADPLVPIERYCSEELIRLSPCAWCFQTSHNGPVNRRQEGPITFGCFNTFAKVTEPMLKIWGRILQAVPESRLLLKSAGLGSASVRRRVQQILGEVGIAPERLELRGRERDYGGHLALYGRMDIGLDTFPYHGTTTTCEAMWMGVPVVSLAGASHVSRVGVSLLNNVGLPEMVAGSDEQYIQIAVDLASDLPRLKELRWTLRQKMEQSPLMDARRFAREVEAAYRQIWRRWCEKT